MAYSADLRNKALNYYEQCKNISQTAATFNLSRNTLYLWIRLKKQTGSLKHQVTGLNAVKLDRQKLAQYVGQHPNPIEKVWANIKRYLRTVLSDYTRFDDALLSYFDFN